MGSLSKRIRRIEYLAEELQKRVGEDCATAEDYLKRTERDLELSLQVRGVTLASDDDDCPESDPDCIPSEPPPKIP